MGYKVGDKVRVRSDLKNTVLYGGLCAVDEMLKKKIVTITSVHDDYYKVVEDDYKWTDGMLEGLVEDELTAEEAIRLKCKMCESISCSECKFSRLNNGENLFCNKFLEKYPEQVVEILKQWKKDHEKKPIKTESVGIVRVIEDTGFRRKCVYEEELTERENPMDAKERVLKEYCQKHDGKFFTVFESICRVKE